MKHLIAAMGLAGLVTSTAGMAEVSDSEITALREQIRILSERLDQLEQASRTTPATQAGSAGGDKAGPGVNADAERRAGGEAGASAETRMAAMSWAERIRWKGDFRYRYENIGTEGEEDRNRQRIRARAHLEADVSDTMKVGLGLASGGDDPVSTNQTLGGGGSTKDINLDLAYFRWTGLEDTMIVGGKFKNMLYRPADNGLLWDGDWNPEGTSLTWDNGTLFATGIGTWVESDSDEPNQEFSYGVQAGVRLALGDSLNLVAGGGYYRFDTAGNRSFFGDDDDFFGNSFDPVTLRYIHDYHEIEAFAELYFDLFGRPAMLFGDYVQNLKADQDDTAYAVGFQTGQARDAGSWEFTWIYQSLEADAVLGLLSDSDFGGGGTNADGHILKGTYAFHQNWNAGFTYFINDIDINTDMPRDFDRVQLDLSFKYK